MASKSVKDLLPFREYDSEGCFLMKDGTYMDIHKFPWVRNIIVEKY